MLCNTSSGLKVFQWRQSAFLSQIMYMTTYTYIPLPTEVIYYLPSRLRKEPEEKGKDTQTGC